MSEVFKPKQFLRPDNEDRVSKYLEEYGDRCRLIAGGTGIYEVAHRGLLSDVEALVDITKLNLSYIRRDGSTLRVGACTTMSSMTNSGELKLANNLGAILDALRAIQPLQVKNVATVAGAICTALPFFDLPVALMSVNASVHIAPSGRVARLSDFIQGYFAVDLRKGEFVREVELPLSNQGEPVGSAFQKFSITGDDWALVNCGVSLSLDQSGKIARVSVVYGGGVGEKPQRAEGIEKLLAGVHSDDEKSIHAIFDNNMEKEVATISDIRASSDYRTKLAKVLGRRAVVEAVKRAGRVGGT